MNIEDVLPLDVNLGQQMFPDMSISPNTVEQYQNMTDFQPFVEDLDSLFGFMHDFDAVCT